VTVVLTGTSLDLEQVERVALGEPVELDVLQFRLPDSDRQR